LENSAIKTLQQVRVAPALSDNSFDSISYRLNNVSTLSDAFSCVSEMCTSFGYSHFIIAHPPEVGCSVANEDIILTNLPLYLVDDLVTMDLLAEWSILEKMGDTSAPFAWNKVNGIQTTDDQSNELADQPPAQLSRADALIASEIDTQFAHCIQAPTRGQRRAFITLFAESPLNLEVDFALVVLFQKIYDHIEKLANSRSRDAGAELNKRELECLNWAAAGKTSGEIAVIVSLSEHTVNHYLNSCCKKLDCVNRTQAVARAIRMRVIK
jgi:DNA-binding CsgD family transcriptional regulator